MPPNRRPIPPSNQKRGSLLFLRERRPVRLASAFPAGPRRPGTRTDTPQFLAQQHAREVKRGGSSRSPGARAIREFQRLSQSSKEMLKKIPKIKLPARRLPPSETEERRGLSEESMERDPVLYFKDPTGNYQEVSREQLEEIENIIVNQGLESGIGMMKEHAPIVARMMESREALEKFAEHFSGKYKAALMEAARNPDPALRAVVLVLFLRTVCRNSPKMRRMLQKQMQQARAT